MIQTCSHPVNIICKYQNIRLFKPIMFACFQNQPKALLQKKGYLNSIVIQKARQTSKKYIMEHPTQ